MRVAGADVWKGQWAVVVLTEHGFESAFVAPRIADALKAVTNCSAIGVDIPIGLPRPGEVRVSDQMVRTYIGPRWPSLFTTPSLDLLQEPTHVAANKRAAAEGRPGISAQAYGLRAAILAVREFAERDDRLFEVHPEASFVRANGGAHLEWSKTSWNGVNLRRRILRTQGIEIPDRLDAMGAVGFADVLDAAIVAWSAARIASGRAESWPSGAERIGAVWS
jgi:predicted RNase H-like nuclease